MSITSRTESEVEIELEDESHQQLFETILSEISMIRAKHTLEVEKLSSIIEQKQCEEDALLPPPEPVKVEDDDTHLKVMREEIKSHKARVASLKQRVDELESQAHRASLDLEECGNREREERQQKESLANRLSDLQKAHNDSLTSKNTEIQSLNGQISALEEAMKNY